MAKKLLVVGVVLLALLAGTGAVYAAAAKNADAAYCGVGVGRMLGGQNLMKEVQEVTGLTTDDIRTARTSGKSFAELLEEKGVDLQAFIAQAVAARKAQVDELVASGKITAEQGQLVMANFQANIEANLNNDTTGPNGRGCGGQGNGGQGGCGMGGGRGMGRSLGRGLGPR